MVWAGSPGPIEIICVRWSWKLVAWPSILAVAPSTTGCVTSSRDFGERAISPPVLRVRRPLKSSGPSGVFSAKGRSSRATSSITSGRTTLSTTTHPSSPSAAQISSAEAEAGRCLIISLFSTKTALRCRAGISATANIVSHQSLNRIGSEARMEGTAMADLIVEKTNQLGILKLNRPDRMNAISVEMLNDLGEALKDFDSDPKVRAIILTGEGRGFCSGLDLKDTAAGRGIGAGLAAPGASHVSTRELPTVTLHRIDLPVICAINGAAAGYGFDLALGCDLRLISDRAKLVPAFAKRGIVPESGGTWYLPRLVGWAKACEIGFIADDIGPARAVELGLANKVVAHEELMEEATRWASKIAANAPLAIRAMKRLFRHGLSEDFESHTHHVLMQLLVLFRSGDFKEGLEAFMAKRDPNFSGR